MSTWLFDVNFILAVVLGVGGGYPHPSRPARTNTVFVTSPISSCKEDVVTFSNFFSKWSQPSPPPPHPRYATKTIFVGGVVMKLIRTPFWKTHITICFLELDLIVSPPSRITYYVCPRVGASERTPPVSRVGGCCCIDLRAGACAARSPPHTTSTTQSTVVV